MSEQELTLQMGTKAEGYEENMQEPTNEYGDMDYNYTPVTNEELQEYSEEPISSSSSQDIQIQEVQVKNTLEQGTELYKDILEFSLPYIGLTLLLSILLFIIKESIKAYIWSRFFK